MASTESLSLVQTSYIAYYGRPADPAGLQFWAERLDDLGGRVDEIIDAFGNLPEFADNFGSLDGASLVNNLFRQMFNRDADQAGLDFYLSLLDSGTKSLGAIALDIANGAQNDDLAALDNKHAFADGFTQSIGDSSAPYTQDQLHDVKELMSRVSDDPATVATASLFADRYLQTLLGNTEDDFSGDVSTTGTVSVDGAEDGHIDIPGDADWFAVELGAGQNYAIELRGFSNDPIEPGVTTLSLTVFDSDGVATGAVASGGGQDPRAALSFTATNSGVHYVEARGDDFWQGQYVLQIDSIMQDPEPQVSESEPAPEDPDDEGQVDDAPVADVVEGEEDPAEPVDPGDATVIIDNSLAVNSGIALTGAQAAAFDVIITSSAATSVTIIGATLAQLTQISVSGPGSVTATVGGSNFDLDAGFGAPTTGDDTILDASGLGSTIDGLAGNDTIGGNDGNDDLRGNDGNDTLNGGSGDDTLWGDLPGGAATAPGDDVLNGGSGNDFLDGEDGNDTLDGGTGDDELWGEDGNDTLNGDAGDDLLYGEDGDDMLAGGDGDDTLWGEDGDDTLNGDDGDDNLNGEDGDDTLNGGAGDDVLYGRVGNDTLNGGTGSDLIYGEDGDDTIDGGFGSDTIYGGDGLDTINGGANNDTIHGDAGNDLITGGSGIDMMTGDGDADVFVFGAGDSGSLDVTADHIGDFTTADDDIRIGFLPDSFTEADGTGFADFAAFKTAAEASFAGGSMPDAYHAFNATGSGDGWLGLDRDGDGTLDEVIILDGLGAGGGIVNADLIM